MKGLGFRDMDVDEEHGLQKAKPVLPGPPAASLMQTQPPPRAHRTRPIDGVCGRARSNESSAGESHCPPWRSATQEAVYGQAEAAGGQ